MSEFTHSVAKEAACLMLYALTSERVSNDRPTRFTGLHIYIIWGILISSEFHPRERTEAGPTMKT